MERYLKKKVENAPGNLRSRIACRLNNNGKKNKSGHFLDSSYHCFTSVLRKMKTGFLVGNTSTQWFLQREFTGNHKGVTRTDVCTVFKSEQLGKTSHFILKNIWKKLMRRYMGACFIFQLSPDYSLPYRFSPLFFKKNLQMREALWTKELWGLWVQSLSIPLNS